MTTDVAESAVAAVAEPAAGSAPEASDIDLFGQAIEPYVEKGSGKRRLTMDERYAPERRPTRERHSGDEGFLKELAAWVRKGAREVHEKGIEVHPLAQDIPQMDDWQLAELCASVADIGLVEPIVRYEGKTLDGRSRELACRIMGVERRYKQFKGIDAEAAARLVAGNIIRRHLSKSQRAAAALLLALRTGGNSSTGGKLRDDIGRKCGVSGRYIQLAINLQEASPGMLLDVRDGKVTLSSAKRLVEALKAKGNDHALGAGYSLGNAKIQAWDSSPRHSDRKVTVYLADSISARIDAVEDERLVAVIDAAMAKGLAWCIEEWGRVQDAEAYGSTLDSIRLCLTENRKAS